MRVIPSLSKEGVVLPWATMIMYWIAWAFAALVLLRGTRGIEMDCIPIPSGELVTTVVTIVLVALALFATLYLVAFQERKTKVYELQAQALKAGTEVDEVSVAAVKSFSNIYVAALLIGAAIAAAVAYVAMISVIPAHVTLNGTLDYIMWPAAATIVAGLVLDRYFVHPIADGTFDDKVIDPLTDAIIAEFQSDTSASASSSDEQIQALIKALQNLKS